MLSWIQLSRLPLKPGKKIKLLNRLGSPGNVLKFLQKKKEPELFKFIDKFNSPEEDLAVLKNCGAGIITYYDSRYPKLLKEIYDPPVLLYYRGNPDLLQEFGLAIVGTRKPTRYGIAVTEYFSQALTEKGVCVISGLAIGCDAVAHKTTLKNKGKTIAVLGTGIDIIYPASNRSIFKDIEQAGLILTEFPPGTPSLPQNFPSRNRIISGLSRGVLVIQAGEWSGSLITAYNALNQGREVFAVPGEIFNKLSIGCNNLIKQGAKPAVNITDIIEEFSSPELISIGDPDLKTSVPRVSEDAQKILDILEVGPADFDKICKLTKFNPGYTLSLLTELELKKQLIKIDGCNYGKKR